MTIFECVVSLPFWWVADVYNGCGFDINYKERITCINEALCHEQL